jgi:DNA-binding response OmpR family regulator
MGVNVLAGYRVMVIEDDYLIALEQSDELTAAGAEVIGPCPNLQTALEELQVSEPTGAIVDINLGRGPSFDAASVLKSRGIPFAFVTGYDASVVPAEFVDIPLLRKPCDPRKLVETITGFLRK